VKGIPSFWLTIFKNVDMLSEMVQVSPAAHTTKLRLSSIFVRKPHITPLFYFPFLLVFPIPFYPFSLVISIADAAPPRDGRITVFVWTVIEVVFPRHAVRYLGCSKHFCCATFVSFPFFSIFCTPLKFCSG
jgi:hypothetical protein